LECYGYPVLGLKTKKMETKNKNLKASVDVQIKDLYCIVKSKEDGFYWVLNLDDHPNSFILDRSYHNFIPPQFKKDHESMVVIQPSI
jgi:hypothetical protein